MNKFGNTSLERLETCHKDLQKIMELAIKRSPIDFGISQGHRSIEDQQKMYAQGRNEPGKIITHIDGVNKKGKHNYYPSLAVDIYAYHPDAEIRKKIAYDLGSLCLIAGVVMSCAKELLEKGEISHGVRWGGNWDQNGVILIDQSFDDMPHFELV